MTENSEALTKLKAQIAEAEVASASAKTDEEWRAAKIHELNLVQALHNQIYIEARGIMKERGASDDEVNEGFPLNPDGTPNYDL